MTWTYTPDFTAQRDRVRFLVGDTNTADQLVSDEEIQYMGTIEGSDFSVAAGCCEAIAGVLGRKVDMTEGKLSIKLSQRSKGYMDRAARLRARAALEAVPFSGGASVADKIAANADSDRIPPAFWRGQLDNPEAVQETPTNTQTGDPFNQVVP